MSIIRIHSTLFPVDFSQFNFSLQKHTKTTRPITTTMNATASGMAMRYTRLPSESLESAEVVEDDKLSSVVPWKEKIYNYNISRVNIYIWVKRKNGFKMHFQCVPVSMP